MSTIETEVAIVGGGPVGLTLAMWLADAGVDVVVMERRSAREAPPVKCNHISARSMEVFRRLGVADALRAAGLPDEHEHDVAFRTSMIGPDFGRIPIPGRLGRVRGEEGPDTAWPTPEPPHRINQLYMEPILFDHASARDRLAILNQVEVETFEQDEHGIDVRGVEATGEAVAVRASYLVGCDGGRSTIRRGLDIAMSGDAVVQRVQSTYIDAPALQDRFASRPAWATIVLNHDRSGTAYAIDGERRWLIHNYLRPDEVDFESVDRDRSLRTITGVGDLDYQLLSKEDWFGRRLIADRFRDRRVFLCGDAAHIWVPYAGYGMNAGVADAADLGWLLGAVSNGWADPSLLDAYEAERYPITEQVSRHAMSHAERMIRNREAIPADLEAPGAAGDEVRQRYGEAMYELNVAQYACAGLNFGYYYDASPAVVPDGTPPPYTMGSFTVSTVPGCRAPHVWMPDGSSLFDHLVEGYTVIGPPVFHDAARSWAEAFSTRGVPCAVVLVEAEEHRGELLLVRPDAHIAWRGVGAGDVDQVAARLTGR